MAIKHSFVSTKQEKSDTSLVRKTEWNADHVIDITTADVPDSADKRYCTDAQKTVIGNTSGTNSGDSATPAETATTIGALIGGAGDATPNDTDFVATSLTTGGILKKITWTNVKAFLKTYFDTLYNKYVHPNHSGDVTSVADGAQTIANSAVTYAKIQNVSATDKVLGRATAGAGAVEEIACTAAGRALIDDASAADQRTTLNIGRPAFFAYPTTTQTNCTGNNVEATVAFGTEVFDNSNNFASDTFTAPVTGIYQLNATVALSDVTSETDGRLKIVTNNRTYTHFFNPSTLEANASYGIATVSVSALADMSAGHTAVVKINVVQGLQIIDVHAGTDSRFSGFLI